MPGNRRKTRLSKIIIAVVILCNLKDVFVIGNDSEEGTTSADSTEDSSTSSQQQDRSKPIRSNVTRTQYQLFEGSHKVPNIMLIFVENINYLQKILDSNQAKGIATILDLPNIQKIREESFLFDHAISEMHSASSSATLLTGLPAIHTGIIKGKVLPFTEIPSVASTGGLPNACATLAESIKQVTKGSAKYMTAFVGFWKLGHGSEGNYLPYNRGFDFWTGIPFRHSNNCHARQDDAGATGIINRTTSHQFLSLMYTMLPIWVAVLLGIFTAYFFKVISWKGLMNAFIYVFVLSFACFILLKIYRVQKSASCLLYHMNEIVEQPYDMENLTLFFTSSVLNLLDLFHAQSQPFFLHLNYLKLREPHFTSTYFRNNSRTEIFDSLLELDWSLGKIMTAMDELNLTDDTLMILTGNRDCQFDANALESIIANERREKQSYIPTTGEDYSSITNSNKRTIDQVIFSKLHDM